MYLRSHSDLSTLQTYSFVKSYLHGLQIPRFNLQEERNETEQHYVRIFYFLQGDIFERSIVSSRLPYGWSLKNLLSQGRLAIIIRVKINPCTSGDRAFSYCAYIGYCNTICFDYTHSRCEKQESYIGQRKQWTSFTPIYEYWRKEHKYRVELFNSRHLLYSDCQIFWCDYDCPSIYFKPYGNTCTRCFINVDKPGIQVGSSAAWMLQMKILGMLIANFSICVCGYFTSFLHVHPSFP